jgi:hypothetical protein
VLRGFCNCKAGRNLYKSCLILSALKELTKYKLLIAFQSVSKFRLSRIPLIEAGILSVDPARILLQNCSAVAL